MMEYHQWEVKRENSWNIHIKKEKKKESFCELTNFIVSIYSDAVNWLNHSKSYEKKKRRV